MSSINAFQRDSEFRPFKCNNCDIVLIAARRGLICPSCDTAAKGWAWNFMCDWNWKQLDKSITRFMSGDHGEFDIRYRR